MGEVFKQPEAGPKGDDGSMNHALVHPSAQGWSPIMRLSFDAKDAHFQEDKQSCQDSICCGSPIIVVDHPKVSFRLIYSMINNCGSPQPLVNPIAELLGCSPNPLLMTSPWPSIVPAIDRLFTMLVLHFPTIFSMFPYIFLSLWLWHTIGTTAAARLSDRGSASGAQTHGLRAEPPVPLEFQGCFSSHRGTPTHPPIKERTWSLICL